MTTIIKEALESTSLNHNNSSDDTEQHHLHTESSATSGCIDTSTVNTSTIATDLMVSIIKQALESNSLNGNIKTCSSSGRGNTSALATTVMSTVIEKALLLASNKIPSITTNTNINTTATTLITMLMKDALISATTRIATNNATTAIATDMIMMIMKSLLPVTTPTAAISTSNSIYNDKDSTFINDTIAHNDSSDLFNDTIAGDDKKDYVSGNRARDDSSDLINDTSAHDNSKDHVVIDVKSGISSDSITMNAAIGTIDYTINESPTTYISDNVIISIADNLSSSLSAPAYLYVSTILANEMVDTMESQIVLSYTYPCPCPPLNIVPDLQQLSTTTMTMLSFGAYLPRTIQISIVNCVALTILAILIAILNLIPVNTHLIKFTTTITDIITIRTQLLVLFSLSFCSLS